MRTPRVISKSPANRAIPESVVLLRAASIHRTLVNDVCYFECRENSGCRALETGNIPEDTSSCT